RAEYRGYRLHDDFRVGGSRRVARHADESGFELHGQLDAFVDRSPGIQISERLEGQNPCGQHVWRDLRRCGADDVQTRRYGPRAGTKNYSSWGGKIALHRFARGNRGRGRAIAPGRLGSKQAWL